MDNPTLEESLFKSLLVPDVIPASAQVKLTVRLSVQFPSGVSAEKGNELTPTETKDEPLIQLDGAEPTRSYTLILTDPDAPSAADPKFGQYRHWVLPGLRVTDTSEVTKTKPPVTSWVGPGPRAGTGIHRYLFILALEPEGFSPAPLSSEFVERRSWKAADWLTEHGCTIVGAAWFIAKNAED